MASELPASTLSTAGGGAPAETVPESSAVDSSQMGKPGRHVVVKRNFRPESDPQFSCCIKLNLHLSVIVISSIMLPLCVGVTAYYVVTSLAKLRTFNPRVLDDFGAAFMMIMSYGCLLVGSVWRIEKLYWAYAIFSVSEAKISKK
uniref:Uncharacterized protein n=1 Tax=Bursaphelenchus xylophilus TaxID=6326 RepID=A0A1I7SID6_BURXY